MWGGAKSGSGAAGFTVAQTWGHLESRTSISLAQIQPRFGPDQHHNLHVSKLTVFMGAGLVEGVWWLEDLCMTSWEGCKSPRGNKTEELSGVKGYRDKKSCYQ